MLAERRGDRTPASVYDMLTTKSDELANGIRHIAPVESTQTELHAEQCAVPEIAAEAPATDQAAIAASVITEETEDADPAPQATILPEPAPSQDEKERQCDTSAHEPIQAPCPQAEAAPTEKPATSSNEEIKLTLNDRFRFRRALFNGSDADMKEAIGILNGLSSLDEITDYLYNDLCLDPDNQDVIDFVELVTANIR